MQTETEVPADKASGQGPIKAIIEAALFAAGRPLALAEIARLFEEPQVPTPAQIRTAIAALADEYTDRAIEIRETAAGFRIHVRERFAGAIARLWPDRPQRYSRALLETLALIAYRQPVTRAEIEAVRGVAVNPNIVRTLLERQWIRVVGHRELPGHPELLGTTREFLDYFGLMNLEQLPPLSELRPLAEFEPAPEQVGESVAPAPAVPEGEAPAEAGLRAGPATGA